MIKYLKLCNVFAETRQWFTRRFPQMTFGGEMTRTGADGAGRRRKKRLVRPLSQVNNFTGTRLRKLKRNNAPEGIQ